MNLIVILNVDKGVKRFKKFADVIYASPLISPSHLVSSEGRESNYSEWQRPPSLLLQGLNPFRHQSILRFRFQIPATSITRASAPSLHNTFPEFPRVD